MSVERFRIVDDPSALSVAQWRAVTRGEPALRMEVLRSLGRQASRPLGMRAFVLEDDEGLGAAALCREILSSTEYSPLDSLLFGRARKFCNALRVGPRPYLSFHLPLGGAAAICVREAPGDVQQRRLDALLGGIESHAAQRRTGVGFMRVEQDSPASLALRSRGYLETETLPTTILPVEWPDFDGYVEHLRRSSLSAACTVRKEWGRARKQGVVIRRIPASQASATDLYHLAHGHYLQKNASEPAYTTDFFARLAPELGEDFLLFEARRNDVRTALLGVVRSGELAWVAWVGFEAVNRPRDFTYFNLVFYALAEYAPSAGIRRMLYGNGAYEAKLRRGCQLRRCSVFYRPHRSAWRAAARPFFVVHRAWHRRKRA